MGQPLLYVSQLETRDISGLRAVERRTRAWHAMFVIRQSGWEGGGRRGEREREEKEGGIGFSSEPERGVCQVRLRVLVFAQWRSLWILTFVKISSLFFTIYIQCNAMSVSYPT